MSDLLQHIDIIFEDVELSSHNSVSIASDLVKQLEMTQQRIFELQNQLTIAQNKMCGELALNIRRRMPGLNVGVGRDGCKIGYRSKHLILQPDVKRGIWNVKSGDGSFARRFLSRHSSKTIITPNFDNLINALVKHFTEHYKSLGEDIVGTGIILVEGKRETIVGLSQWYQQQQAQPRKINSRSSKRVIG